MLFRDLLLGYSQSEENEVYIDAGSAKNVIRSQPSHLLPSPPVLQSRNKYLQIPLSASGAESSYKTAGSGSVYSDYEDYYYQDYNYDLGFPYQSIDKYQAQWGQAHQRKVGREEEEEEEEEALDQFIFPGQYVISQPHSSSTPYDRRLIIKLPDNSLTPPDQILGMMGINQHHQGNPATPVRPVTYQNIVQRRIIS